MNLMFSRRRMLRAAAVLGSGGAPALGHAASSPSPGAGGVLSVALRVYVAQCPPQHSPVRSEAWVGQHVAAAQAVLRPHQVQLTSAATRFYPERCDLLNAAHRDHMATYITGENVVPVLVVQRVRDLDVHDYDLMGVHWRYNGKQAHLSGRRWILLTARAEPPVLAHELCHFFGLPHDPAGGNLMTPGPSSPAWSSAKPPRPFQPVLTHSQAEALRRAVRSWIGG